MPLDVSIVGNDGQGHGLAITDKGKLHVQETTTPPDVEQDQAIPFRQYFTSDGTPSGSNEMRVNGSTTNVDFFISAVNDFDIYIKNIAVLIADAGAQANDFGKLNALTNGIRFYWSNQAVGEIEIHEGLKTNFSFIRLALGNPAFGAGADAFRLQNVIGVSEAYIPNINITDTFGMPYGFRIKAGTKDKLCFTIRDNLVALDQFNIIAYGMKVQRD